MPRSVAINVGANTNAPGFRGPVHPDGRFEFVPIPEDAPTREPPPTYADLDLAMPIPAAVRDTPVHLDPEFAEYPYGERYTYGDPYGVKARPLLELAAGDYVFFYATLDSPGDPAPWMPPDWGAYLVGQFRLARDPVDGEAYHDLPTEVADRFRNNAHVRRETFDAAVLLLGDDTSRLYDRTVPLSAPGRGVDPNHVVTDFSSDSGRGPWWRRPLRFDADATDEVLSRVSDGPPSGVTDV